MSHFQLSATRNFTYRTLIDIQLEGTSGIIDRLSIGTSSFLRQASNLQLNFHKVNAGRHRLLAAY